MTTDNDFKNIAASAYWTDPLMRDPPLANGEKIPSESPTHILISDPVSDPVTGFQAMTVAPLVDGLPDLSQVYVSFAGTNPGHHADIASDAQVVIGGETAAATQAGQAVAYADKVRAQYPTAAISTVGHSLGGYLALYVASENHWAATTFNAPDPWESLSPQARLWLQQQTAAGRNPLRNFVNEWDPIGHFHGNKTAAAIYLKGDPGRDALWYHNLETGSRFGTDGTITGAGADERGMVEITENLLSSLPPAARGPSAAAISGVVGGLHDPIMAATLGRSVSGLMVLVDTVAAASLAATIFRTTDLLLQLKTMNSGLIPQMQRDLDEAMCEMSAMPTITVADIENCVVTHRLRVRDNIDEKAVHAVNRRLDDHIDTVGRLFDGISAAIRNAAAQDAQWASVYGQAAH